MPHSVVDRLEAEWNRFKRLRCVGVEIVGEQVVPGVVMPDRYTGSLRATAPTSPSGVTGGPKAASAGPEGGGRMHSGCVLCSAFP